MKIDFIGLEIITFHDLPLNKLSIELEPSPELVIDISEFDEEINGYIEKRIIFGNIESINPKSDSFKDYSDSEIYSFDYFLKGSLFYGKMICLKGFGKPTIEIEFSCRSVTINEIAQVK